MRPERAVGALTGPTLLRGGGVVGGAPFRPDESMTSCSPASSSSRSSNKATNKSQEIGPVMVLIHVHDEARKVTKDFECERELLLKEMPYFKNYLQDEGEGGGDVNILVHCDMKVFDWLLQYAKQELDRGAQDKAQAPQLEVSSVVSILVSSSFLMMMGLVEECLQYVALHLNEVIRLPIDLGCLTEAMLARLANIMSITCLAQVQDRKDKVMSRLCKRRIEEDLKRGVDDGPSAVQCCQHCSSLYPSKLQFTSACPAAPVKIGFRGCLEQRHNPVPNWNLASFARNLHRRGMSWSEVFWMLWGASHELTCKRCELVVSAADIGQCRKHVDTPFFPPNGSASLLGIFPCCQQPVHMFATHPVQNGCIFIDHDVDLNSVDSDTQLVLQLQRHNISRGEWRKAVAEEILAKQGGERSDEATIDQPGPALAGSSMTAARLLPFDTVSSTAAAAAGLLPDAHPLQLIPRSRFSEEIQVARCGEHLPKWRSSAMKEADSARMEELKHGLTVRAAALRGGLRGSKLSSGKQLLEGSSSKISSSTSTSRHSWKQRLQPSKLVVAQY